MFVNYIHITSPRNNATVKRVDTANLLLIEIQMSEEIMIGQTIIKQVGHTMVTLK